MFENYYCADLNHKLHCGVVYCSENAIFQEALSDFIESNFGLSKICMVPFYNL